MLQATTIRRRIRDLGPDANHYGQACCPCWRTRRRINFEILESSRTNSRELPRKVSSILLGMLEARNLFVLFTPNQSCFPSVQNWGVECSLPLVIFFAGCPEIKFRRGQSSSFWLAHRESCQPTAKWLA